jgi:hypothetical protein
MTFQWITPPDKLADAVEAYGQKVIVALHAVAVRWGQEVQNQVRQNAPWEDRTGNARTGLFFAVDGFGLTPVVGEVNQAAQAHMTDVASVSGDAENLVVVVGHTVFYGVYLELSRAGKNAILLSTIQGNLPKLNQYIKALFSG